MRQVINYLGQVRLYSLADLLLLLVAAGVSPISHRFWGTIFLWLGFLAHLESVHHDRGREPVPRLAAWLFWLQALTWWKGDVSGDMFILLSLIYAQKKRWHLGLVSPLIRGLQTLVLLGQVVGYNHGFPWLAAALVAVRNLLGDFRDAQQDAREGIHTWPAVLGCRSRPFIHLLALFATTIVWWLYAAGVSIWGLSIVLMIEVATYWLTPRASNKHAAVWLYTKILRNSWR